MIKTLHCEFIDFNNVDALDTYKAGQNKRSGTPNRIYQYLYTGSKSVEPDDYAIVHNGTTFGIVKIHRVQPGITDKVTKPVIEVISANDLQKYREDIAAIRKHRQNFDMLDFLREAEKKLEGYRKLAETNPDAARILAEIEAFNIDETSKPVETTITAEPAIANTAVNEENVHER